MPSPALPASWLMPLLEGQGHILERVAEGAPLPDLLADLCRLVEQLLPGRRCAILTVAGSVLRVGSAPNLPELFMEAVDGSPIGQGATPCGLAAATLRPVTVEDFQKDPSWSHTAPLAIRLGLASCLSMPIPGDHGVAIGTFALYAPEPGPPTEEEQALLNACTGLASAVLRGHARETEVRALLVQSEAHYRQTFLNLPVPAFIWDPDTQRFLAVNAAALNTYGYTASEFLSLRLPDLRFSEDLPRMDEVLRRMPRGYHRAGPVRHRTKAGDSLVVDLSSHDVVFEGRPARVTVAQDITERLQMEARYRQLVEAIAEGIAIVDEEDRFEFANPAAHQVYGIEPGGLTGRALSEFLPGGQMEIVHQETRLRKQGQSSSYQLTIRRPDGEERLLEINAVPRLQADGTFKGAFAVFLDITDRVATEQALRKSEERFRRLFEAIPQGVLIHQEGIILYANPAALRISGRSQISEVLGHPVLSFVHPDDRGLILERQKRLAAGEQVPFVELRCQWPDGSVVEVESLSLLLEHGSPPTYMVVFHDISQRKRDTEALRQSEQRLRRLFEATPQGVVIHRGGVLVYINPAAAELAGLPSPQAGVGRSVLDFIHGEDHAQTLDRMVRAQRGEVLQPAVFRCKTPEGKVTPCESNTRILEEGDPPTCLVVFQDISERLSSQEALRQSEHRFRNLFEAIPEGVLIHQGGRIQYANPAALVIAGLPSLEAGLGAPVLSFIHAKDHAQTLDRQERLLRGETLAPVTFHCQRPGGETVPCESVARILEASDPPTFVVLFSDITDRLIAEEALRQSEHRFRKLFEEIPLAVVIHQRGAIQYANPAALHAVGLDQGAPVVGMSISTFIPPEDLPEVAGRQRALEAGQEVGWTELRHLRADGTPFPVDSRMMVLEPGNPPVFLSVFQDISERKRTEEGMRQAQKLESLGVLAGGIAHDFNNLLTAMMGNLNLAQDALPPGHAIHTYLQHLELAVTRASDLTRQMLAYSGRGRFVVKPLDLNRMVEEMANLLRVSISKRVELKLELAPQLPQVEGDASQLQQVVMNLVINGSEAMGERDGQIRIRTTMESLDAAAITTGFPGQPLNPGRFVCLEVLDTGEGIPPELLSRIFDPFYTTKATGRGLGLSALQGILRGHQAGIQLQSRPGQGTCFRLYFPACAVAAPAQLASQLSDPPHRSGGRILLVDDEAALREPLADMLALMGFEVVEAADGVEALERFEALDGQVRAAILDLTMPRMDGRQTLAALRERNPTLPVLLSSGYEEGEASNLMQGLGPTGFLQKPYTLKVLRKAVMDLLPPD